MDMGMDMDTDNASDIEVVRRRTESPFFALLASYSPARIEPLLTALVV